MATITVPGRTKGQVFHMVRAQSIKMEDGTHAGFSLGFAEYGTGKLITIELDHHEADQLVNWQNYATKEREKAPGRR